MRLPAKQRMALKVIITIGVLAVLVGLGSGFLPLRFDQGWWGGSFRSVTLQPLSNLVTGPNFATGAPYTCTMPTCSVSWNGGYYDTLTMTFQVSSIPFTATYVALTLKGTVTGTATRFTASVPAFDGASYYNTYSTTSPPFLGGFVWTTTIPFSALTDPNAESFCYTYPGGGNPVACGTSSDIDINSDSGAYYSIPCLIQNTVVQNSQKCLRNSAGITFTGASLLFIG